MKVKGLKFRVEGHGLTDPGIEATEVGLRVRGSRFRVYGSGFGV